MNASKKYEVVLIGLGMVSKVYVEALNSLSNNISVIGIIASNINSSNKFLSSNQIEIFKNIKIFSSIDEICNNDSIDFAILTTPPNVRIEIVKKLIQSKIPILMEKPIERNLSNAKEIEILSLKAQIPIGIMLQHRARPSALKLKNILSQDFQKIGKLSAVEIYIPWWREQSYYDQPGRGTYSRDGGGVLISQAIHTLDLALQFTGQINAVTSMNKTSSFHSMESEDFVSAGLEFEDQVFGTLFASTASYPGRTEEIILHYKNVTVLLKSNLLKLFWQNGKEETIGDEESSGAGADPMAFTSDWHRDMILDFQNSIKEKREPIASISSAIEVHRLISMLEYSSKKQMRIKREEI